MRIRVNPPRGTVVINGHRHDMIGGFIDVPEELGRDVVKKFPDRFMLPAEPSVVSAGVDEEVKDNVS